MITNLKLKTIKNKIKKRVPRTYEVVRTVLIAFYFGIRRLYLFFFFRKAGLYTFEALGLHLPIYLDPKNGLVDEQIRWKGSFEPAILAYIQKHLSPGNTYVDIGLNIGQHALVAAATVGKSGRVIGYEPIPHIAKQAELTFKRNAFTQATVRTYGLGSKDIKVLLYLEKNNIGASTVRKHRNTSDSITIQIRDALAELQSLGTIDMIKIDTEGQEAEILERIKPLLQKMMPKIIFEFTPEKYKHTENPLELVGRLGYKLTEIETGEGITNIPDWVNRYEDSGKIQSNIYCDPK